MASGRDIINPDYHHDLGLCAGTYGNNQAYFCKDSYQVANNPECVVEGQSFCYVAYEGDRATEEPCPEGPLTGDGNCGNIAGQECCQISQAFCSTNISQTVQDILPTKAYALTYNTQTKKYDLDYSQGEKVLAQLWNRIYEIFLNIFNYPNKINGSNKEVRGVRNPYIYKLVQSIANNNIIAPPIANNNGEYSWYGWTEGDGCNGPYQQYDWLEDAGQNNKHLGFYTRKLYYPVFPDFNLAKQGYKFIADKKILFFAPIGDYYAIPIKNESEFLQKKNFLYVYALYFYTNTYEYLSVMGFTEFQTYDPNRQYYMKMNENEWGNTGLPEHSCFIPWISNPMKSSEIYYEKLKSSEKYVYYTNKSAGASQLPQFKNYNFNNKTRAQWTQDILDGLVYIYDADFMPTAISQFDDILFQLYTQVLDKLDIHIDKSTNKADLDTERDEKIASKTLEDFNNDQNKFNTRNNKIKNYYTAQKAAVDYIKDGQPIITEKLMIEIQLMINNYELNGDRCFICNTMCNSNCESGTVWQAGGCSGETVSGGCTAMYGCMCWFENVQNDFIQSGCICYANRQ